MPYQSGITNNIVKLGILESSDEDSEEDDNENGDMAGELKYKSSET